MSPSLSAADQKTESVNSLQGAAAAGLPIPGPRGLALLRSLLRMRTDPTGLFQDLIARHGDAVSLPTPRLNLLLLNHPEHVVHVLQRNGQAYRKSASYRELELVLGKGLLTSEGADWRGQRRLAQPHFHRTVLGRFAGMVTQLTQEMLEGWSRRDAAQPLDVHAEMCRLALRMAGQALFGTDLAAESDRLGQALRVVLPFVQRRTEKFVNLPVGWPLPSHLRFRRAMRGLEGLVHALIEGRRGDGAEAPPDLLTMMLHARDPESGQTMDPSRVRDEIMTFLLAGHETTANALAWTLYALARHPEAAERLRAEVHDVLGGRVPGVEDLPRLEYTRRVIHESMRLYPPAWVLEREALEDDVVGGYAVPKGSMLMLCPYTTHRHAQSWDRPESFDPDRFAPERAAARPRGAYFPFGEGQRKCIGEAFALMEMQLALPMIVQHGRLELVPGHPVELDAGITLRPRHGILMTRRRGV
jgi:cytochrome P450